jgi:seryl-tRNA synthetase
MGILDKAKQVAGQVGEAAKKGASQVQTKVEHTQTRRKADEAAKQLGYLVYKERIGGASAGEEADKLVAEIKDLEQQLAEAPAEPAGTEGETPQDKPE